MVCGICGDENGTSGDKNGRRKSGIRAEAEERWCVDCEQVFCANCLNVHNKMKISAAHQSVTMKEKEKQGNGLGNVALVDEKETIIAVIFFSLIFFFFFN